MSRNTDEENNIETVLGGMLFLLGAATSMLFEMQKHMTSEQIRFWAWWKDSMYDVAYNNKPITMFRMPEKGFTRSEPPCK